MTIDDVIEVTISGAAVGPTTVGFGTPLLLCHHDLWLARLRTFTSLTELTDAGVPTSHPIYRKALKLKSQNPSPAKFVIGKRTRPVTQIVHLIPRNFRDDFGLTLTYEAPNGGASINADLDPDDLALSKTFTAVFGTDLLSTSTPHGLSVDDPVTFAGADLPDPLAAETTYYVIASGLTATDFRVATTVGDSAVDLSDNGTGAMTVEGAANAASVSSALATALSAAVGVTVSASSGTHVVLTSTTPGALFNLRNLPLPSDLALLDVSTDPGIDEDLADCKSDETEDNSWYGITIDTVGAEEIESAAAWTEAQKKLFFYTTSDWDCLDPSEDDDIATTLQDASYARTVGLGSYREMLSYSADAWVGQKLPTQPGSATWYACILAGITKDKLTGGEVTAAKGKNLNVYTDVAGLGFTEESVTAVGGYIDTKHFEDFWARRMQEAILALISAASQRGSKIPFTDVGIQMLVSTASSIMQLGQDVGGFAPGWSVIAPRVADILTADKTARTLRGVVCDATFAGAIHKVRLRGVLSL